MKLGCKMTLSKDKLLNPLLPNLFLSFWSWYMISSTVNFLTLAVPAINRSFENAPAFESACGNLRQALQLITIAFSWSPSIMSMASHSFFQPMTVLFFYHGFFLFLILGWFCWRLSSCVFSITRFIITVSCNKPIQSIFACAIHLDFVVNKPACNRRWRRGREAGNHERDVLCKLRSPSCIHRTVELGNTRRKTVPLSTTKARDSQQNYWGHENDDTCKNSSDQLYWFVWFKTRIAIGFSIPWLMIIQ